METDLKALGPPIIKKATRLLSEEHQPYDISLSDEDAQEFYPAQPRSTQIHLRHVLPTKTKQVHIVAPKAESLSAKSSKQLIPSKKMHKYQIDTSDLLMMLKSSIKLIHNWLTSPTWQEQTKELLEANKFPNQALEMAGCDIDCLSLIQMIQTFTGRKLNEFMRIPH